MLEQLRRPPAPSRPADTRVVDGKAFAGKLNAEIREAVAVVLVGDDPASRTKLGADLTMDLAAAETAIRERVAVPLKLSLTEATAGILRVAHANIVRGIRVVSVERGDDPRRLRPGAVRRRGPDARHPRRP